MQLSQILLVVLPELALGIVLGDERVPVGASVLVQVSGHLPHRDPLLLVALDAPGDQRIGDDALEGESVLVALALVQQAADVVGGQPVVGQDGVDVDVVVLGGVEVGCGSRRDHGEEHQGEFHDCCFVYVE